MQPSGPFGITTRFQELYPTTRQVSHALLTRSPLSPTQQKPSRIPFDLHVLSTPPAFVLSQNQTLHTKTVESPTQAHKKNKKTTSKTTPHHKAERSLTQTNTHTPSTNEKSTGILLAIKNPTKNHTPPHKQGAAFNQTTTYKTYKHKSSTKHALEFSNHHHTHQNTPPHRKHTPTGSNKKQYTPHPTPHNPGVSHTPTTHNKRLRYTSAYRYPGKTCNRENQPRKSIVPIPYKSPIKPDSNPQSENIL